MTLFISAGHYPAKPGAGYEGFYEHDEAVLWRDRIFEALFNSSPDDIASPVPVGVLKEKVAYINNRSQDNSLALEVHFNAARDADNKPIGRGCETLYMPGSASGKRLAELVNGALAEHFKPDRGVKEGWYRMDPKHGPDFFLRRTRCPSVIIEPDFIHRKQRIVEHRDECCKAIAEALLRAQTEIYGDKP